MTDRAHAFIVVLDDDYRIGDRMQYPSINGDDEGALLPTDADAIAHAIRMLKGVISVEPVVVTLEDHMARTRVRRELQGKLFDVLREKRDD